MGQKRVLKDIIEVPQDKAPAVSSWGKPASQMQMVFLADRVCDKIYPLDQNRKRRKKAVYYVWWSIVGEQ